MFPIHYGLVGRAWLGIVGHYSAPCWLLGTDTDRYSCKLLSRQNTRRQINISALWSWHSISVQTSDIIVYCYLTFEFSSKFAWNLTVVDIPLPTPWPLSFAWFAFYWACLLLARSFSFFSASLFVLFSPLSFMNGCRIRFRNALIILERCNWEKNRQQHARAFVHCSCYLLFFSLLLSYCCSFFFSIIYL